jgi:hypothetical protein
MAYTEFTKGMAYTDITGISSKDLATDPEKASIISEIGELLKEYTQVVERNKSDRNPHSNRVPER